MPRDRQVTFTMLSAGSANQNSDWQELTGFDFYTLTVRLSVSAATLTGSSVSIRGTSNTPQDPAEPLLANGVLISAADSALPHTAGVITIPSNPGIGIHTIVLAFPQFPQFVRTDWVFGAGGGTVSLTVRAAGW